MNATSVLLEPLADDEASLLFDNLLGRAEIPEARRANDLWDEVGDAGVRVTARQPLGEAEYYLGRFDLADEIFREQAEQLTALGETGVNSTVRGLLALSLCYQAKFDEAEVQATMSRELAAEDDLASQASWRLAQAQVLSHREDFVAALALADEAVTIYGGTDYISGHGEAHEIRGGILLAARRAPEAREAFAEALLMYERKGIVLWAERARSRLSALSA